MTKLFVLSLLSLLTIVSCAKEEPQTTVAPTREVWLDLEAQPEAEGLRLLQKLAQGSITTPFIGNATKFRILLCVNRSGASAPVYQQITLTVPADQAKAVKDQSATYYATIRPRYSGKITVPSDGSGDYQLSAAILDYDIETDGVATGVTDSYQSVDVAAENVVSKIVVTPANQWGSTDTSVDAQSSDQEPMLVQFATTGQRGVDFKIPYIAESVSVPLTASGDALQRALLSFKPSGKLIRFAINDNAYYRLWSRITSYSFTKLRIKTNAFFPDWNYDLANLASGNLSQGYRAALGEWEHTYTINIPLGYSSKNYSFAPVGLANSSMVSTTEYMGLWVMPNKSNTGLRTQIYLTDNSGKEYLAFESTSPLGSGGTQRVLLGYPVPVAYNGFPNGNKLPHEYLAGLAKDEATVSGTAANFYDLKTRPEDGVAFDLSSIVYMSHSAALAAQASNPTYKLPAPSELAGILPAGTYVGESPLAPGFPRYQVNAHSIWDTRTNTGMRSVRDEIVTVGGETRRYVANYLGADRQTMYAVRFQDPAGQDKSRRMIYRYRYVGTFGVPGYRLEVTMKYIGADDTYADVDQLVAVGDLAFTDNAHTIYLPATGNTPTLRNKFAGFLVKGGIYYTNAANHFPYIGTARLGRDQHAYAVPLFTRSF